MNDRRQVPRWQIGKQARYFLEGAGAPGQCVVEDINLKGLRLSLPERLPFDRNVKMSLTFDDDLFIDVEMSVPWVREGSGRFTHGLCFTRIMDQDRENIYKYVHDRYPQFFRQNWWSGAEK